VTGRVVLEFRRNELSGSLWWMVPADPRLGVDFEFFEGSSHRFTVRFPNAIIAADQGG
jgi:hypothetical protein